MTATPLKPVKSEIHKITIDNIPQSDAVQIAQRFNAPREEGVEQELLFIVGQKFDMANIVMIRVIQQPNEATATVEIDLRVVHQEELPEPRALGVASGKGKGRNRE